MENLVDKFSIKNLLFTKAIPNYEIPIPVEGHKIFPCIDCGDKFVFESSFESHINRKSALITYMCRHCGQTKVFYNRCKLLCHIRAHSFKTATINVQDLKIEPVPFGVYKYSSTKPNDGGQKSVTSCFECKKVLPSIGIAYKDRSAHFMQYTNEVHSCPVCLFTLPTLCGLRAHMRFHLKCAPFYCPECGVNIIHKNVYYPFNHDCEGFNMMRATARLRCPIPQCQLLHPNEFKDHMKAHHVKKVYKCPVCVVACFNETTMERHLLNHIGTENKALIFYQCELCPGRLVLQNHIENHLSTHVNPSVFPCWICGMVFKEVFALVDHHMKKHDQMTDAVKNMCTSIIQETGSNSGKSKPIYRVVKRCDQCKRNFTYKCKYNEIPVLPKECPYKCTSKTKSSTASENTKNHIVCNMCQSKVPCSWNDIKKHYATVHKSHRCLEPKLVVNRIDVQKYLTRDRKKITRRTKKRRRQQQQEVASGNGPVPTKVTIAANQCGMCGHFCDSKEMLESHLVSHRDPCMAYQCLECGQSFVVKPSFSKHLMLAHGIYDTEEYVNSKQCYNENALDKQQKDDTPTGPIKENQCTICMDQFGNAEDLKKHFRVHGMAFLLKNTSKLNENTALKASEIDSKKDQENIVIQDT